MNTPEKWMQEALSLGAQARFLDEVPVGAILVKDSEVLGRGLNKRETTQRTLGHAEIEALEDYNRHYGQWRLPVGTSLFVTVEPCLMCAGAFLWARVTAIYYGCPDPRNAGLRNILPLIEEGRFDHRIEVVEGICKRECSEALSSYFKGKRKSETSQSVESFQR